MNEKYFTLVRKDVLDNPDLSLEAKGLYCLICYDTTASLRRLLLDESTREETINASKELERYDYASFYGLDEVKDKYSYIGLSISIQPIDSFKDKVDRDYEKFDL